MSKAEAVACAQYSEPIEWRSLASRYRLHVVPRVVERVAEVEVRRGRVGPQGDGLAVEKRSCVMMIKDHNRFQMSEMAGNELFEMAFMFKLKWRFDDQKVGDIDIYCTPLSLGPGPLCGPRCVADKPHRLRRTDDPSFLGYFFSALSTPAVDNFVCQTMRDSCPGVWAANELTNIGECEAKLAALPLAEGEELYVDGNTCASSRA
tara:strand:+ start:198 stop:812 length:615 start_codon:yes stop_codon:yes gene_type:complete